MENVSERKLAWLAGIIDGEGTITYWKARSRYVRKQDGVENQYVRCTVSIANTNEKIINEIALISKALGIPTTLVFQKRAGQHKDCWYISWKGSVRTQAILQAVLPYLIGKAAQAELVLFIIEHRRSTRTRTQVDISHDKWLTDQLGKLSDLNRRGKV